MLEKTQNLLQSIVSLVNPQSFSDSLYAETRKFAGEEALRISERRIRCRRSFRKKACFGDDIGFPEPTNLGAVHKKVCKTKIRYIIKLHAMLRDLVV